MHIYSEINTTETAAKKKHMASWRQR